jgi:integrase
MAYIRPYKGRWRAEVQRHGSRVTHMADTKREAAAWALQKEAELDSVKVSGGRTFEGAAAHYVDTVSAAKDSQDWERRRLDAAAEFFGRETKLATIDSALIGKWRDARLKTVSGSTVNREANLLRNLFTVACNEWRWIEKNPFKGVRMPKENLPRQAVWPWQAIRRILRADRSGKTAETVRMFHVALHTGLRLKEVVGCTFDARRKVLVLGKTKGTREGQVVEVPVTRRAARALPRLLAQPFTTNENEASTLFSKMCAQLLVEGLTFHDSRATALTLLSRRMDVMTLAKISRHKDLSLLLNTYYRESAEQISRRI